MSEQNNGISLPVAIAIAKKYGTQVDASVVENKVEEIIQRPDSIVATKEEINLINESLDNIETEKATKLEVNIERERIDSFTTLKEGSTTGDAELIDGRIGADGVIYSNIGSSMRTQFSKLNENVFTLTKILTNVKWVLKHIDVTGSIVSNNNKNVVTEEKHLLLKGTTIGCDVNYKFQIALYDKITSKFIERIVWIQGGNKYVLTNDYLVRIEISDLTESIQLDTTISNHINVLSVEDNISNNTNNMKKLKEDVVRVSNVTDKLIKKEILMIQDYYIPLGDIGVGNVVNVTPVPLSTYRYSIVNCVENDVLLISGTGGNNPRLWGFVDSNNVLLSMSEPIKTENNLRLVAPKNSTKFIINDLKTGKVSYKGEDLLPKVSELNNNVSTINDKTKIYDEILIQAGGDISKIKNKSKTVTLLAKELSDGVGTPLYEKYFDSDVCVPYWSMPSDTETSISVLLGALNEDYNSMKISAIITNPFDKGVNTKEVLFSQISSITYGAKASNDYTYTTPVQHNTSDKNIIDKIVIKNLMRVDTTKSMLLSIYRKTADTNDNNNNPIGVIGIEIEYKKPIEIQSPFLYSAWPFIESVGNKLVCVYSRGLGHEDGKSPNVYRKTSNDGGYSWSSEKMIVNTPNVRDAITGKGKDSNGNMLMWVRKGSPGGATTTHDIYRTSDGEKFEQISNNKFLIVPSHIGDIFNVPTKGLMAFYNTVGTGTHSWGLVTSTDNGVTWTQREIEGSLQASECPMEISCVRLNDGKLIAIGRKEARSADGTLAQFQLQSTDNGITWTKKHTNITDIALSTPSIIYNDTTNEINNYYFHRGVGALKVRKSKVSDVWDKPLNWSSAEEIAYGTTNMQDTGNVNAVAYGENHITVYYSGDSTNTGIYATII